MYVCMYVCMYVGENDQDGEVVDLIKTLTYLKPSRRGCPSHVLAHMKLFQYGSLIAEEKTREIMVHTLFHIHTFIHTYIQSRTKADEMWTVTLEFQKLLSNSFHRLSLLSTPPFRDHQVCMYVCIYVCMYV